MDFLLSRLVISTYELIYELQMATEIISNQAISINYAICHIDRGDVLNRYVNIKIDCKADRLN